MDYFLCKVMSCVTFGTFFVTGGYLRHKEMIDRWRSTHKSTPFRSRHEAIRRVMDYAIVMFMKNGFLYAYKRSLFVGFTMASISAISIYRDKFSLWYTGAIPGFYAFVVGLRNGIVPALLKFATVGPGIFMTAGITMYPAAYLLQQDINLSNLVNFLRQNFIVESFLDSKHNTEILAVAEEQGFNFNGKMKAEKIWRQNRELAKIEFESENPSA